MKTFDQYLDENKLELAVMLIEQCNFPLKELAKWYSAEGCYLSKTEISQVMEGFWAEAENTFWGDTWRNTSKPPEPPQGGLYNMGQQLWNKMTPAKKPEMGHEQSLDLLRKLGPKLGFDADDLISKIGKPQTPVPQSQPQSPMPNYTSWSPQQLQ